MFQNMSRTNYQRGADKERRIMNKFEGDKFTTLRSAGSHSPIDVVIINHEDKIIRLIQSKLGYISKPAKERIIQDGIKFNGTYAVVFELWAD